MSAPLLEVERGEVQTVVPRDGFVEARVRSVEGGWELWCEWAVELPGGGVDYRSAQVDADEAAAIFALPNFGAGLQRAASNTHPKVIG